MGVMNINVEIVSGNDIGGVYPFVVACFDNDLSNELHKTGATTGGGPKCVWDTDNTFSVDFTSVIKNLHADGKPEPTYLTFFVFDTGAPGIPSLGSAGVLLATVRDKNIAKGDFPMVNGTGSLTIIVSAEKGRAGGWFQSDGAKMAGAVGAVGLGALAAGLGAMAVNKRREKKKREAAEAEGEGEEEEDGGEHVEEPGAAAPALGAPEVAGVEAAAAAAPAHYPAQAGARMMAGPHEGALPPSAAGAAGAAGAAPGARPWWDPETSEDDDEDPASTAGPGGAAGAQGGYPAHNVYAQQAAPYQGGNPYAQEGYQGGHEAYAERPQ